MRLVEGIVLSLFLFFSCQNRPHKYVEPILQPYLIRFLELCSTYNVDCRDWTKYSLEIVEFKPSLLDLFLNIRTENVIGLCNHFSKSITIKKQWFDIVYQYGWYEDIESVVFHEFGHCILNKKHTKDGTYSIMAPAALAWGYNYNYQKLMDEFFGCTNNCPSVKFDYLRYSKLMR